jgi:SAC3 family protein LENG8/THP3
MQGDLGEYNQCQTRLSELYEEGLKGARLEFLAYRIIYTLYTQNRSGMLSQCGSDEEINELLATLTYAEKQNEAVSHALEVREALASRNYHRLFRLYNAAPNMGGYLMDFFVERERVAACCIICKTYHLLK